MLALTRLVVFYDGNYFKQGNLYFRYAKDRGWMSFAQLHRLLEHFVADRLNEVGPSGHATQVRIVEAHYYDGRATTRAADDFQLRKDRDFEMSLIDAGIVPHYLALREKRRRGIGDEPPATSSRKRASTSSSRSTCSTSPTTIASTSAC